MDQAKQNTPSKKTREEKSSNRKRFKKRVIDPVDLVIHETASGIGLWFNDHPVLLSNGEPLVHPRRTLVEHIQEEFSGFGTVTLDAEGRVLKPDMISSYVLLSAQQLMEADSKHPFIIGFEKWLLLDPCLSRCAGPEGLDQMARRIPLSDYFHENGIQPPDFAQIPVEISEDDDVESILRQRIEPMLGLGNFHSDEFIKNSKTFAGAVDAIFRRLGPEEWVVMYYLFHGHQAVLFPLLLVTGNCTPQEYANGLMAAHGLLTTAFVDVSNKAHEMQARGFREDAQVVLQFLEHARCPWAKEILKGENEVQEFKATLRYDLETKLHNAILEHSVLKNVTAFLNSQGGTVFVGVKDDGEIAGIELDGFQSNDKWELHLISRIGQQIGKRFLPMCSIKFDLLHGRTVSRITIGPSDEPAFLNERPLLLKGKKDVFFIRGGSSAQKLDYDETTRYITKRFPTAPTPPTAS